MEDNYIASVEIGWRNESDQAFKELKDTLREFHQKDSENLWDVTRFQIYPERIGNLVDALKSWAVKHHTYLQLKIKPNRFGDPKFRFYEDREIHIGVKEVLKADLDKETARQLENMISEESHNNYNFYVQTHIWNGLMKIKEQNPKGNCALF